MGLLTPEAKEAFAGGIVHLGILVELDFTTGIERYWSGTHPITWDGEIWQPTGQLGKVSPIESSEDLHANGLTLTMTGLPGDAMRNVRRLTPDQYKGRPGRFITAIFDQGFQNIIHAIPRHFRIDGANYSVTPESGAAVAIQLENEVKHASRTRVRRYSDQQQQAEFPNDRAFEYLPYLNSGVEVKWGTKGLFFRQ